MNLSHNLPHLDSRGSYWQRAVLLAIRCRHSATNQDGVALVLALLTMMLVAMIGLFGAVTGQTELQVASNEQSAKKVLDVADAGVRHALRLLAASGNGYQNGFNDELSNSGTGGALAAAGSTLTTYPGEAGTQYRFFPFGGSASQDGYYFRAIDNYDADGSQNTDTDQKFIIISRGKFGTAEKTIEALVSPPTPCAITTGNRLDVGGNVGSTDIQVNTTDGFGACVHSNNILNVGGSSSFPDGASSSLGNPPGNCNGNPSIAGGNCNNVLWNQPQRILPDTNPGLFGKWVADLGNAVPTGPYYILHPATNTIRRGGGCVFTTTPPNALSVGRCGSTISYPAQTLPSNPSPADQAGPASLTGITLSGANGGTCTFSGNNIQPGIYYCEGIVVNQGQVGGNGVTIISRDDMRFTSQTNLSAFFSDANNGTNADETAMTTLNNLAPSPTKDAALAAMGFLRNLVMMVGNDLDFSGNNTVIVGIILIHNEINMTGGKTITGYIIADGGQVAFPGDPHPAGSASTINPALTFNNFLGSSTINYENFGTSLPLGPPVLRAWNDGQW